MNKMILATLENCEGLSVEMTEKLGGFSFPSSGIIFNVKNIEIANGSYNVLIEADVQGGKTSFWVKAENVTLYEKYDDDFKVYNPLNDPELNSQQEKGQN